MPIDGLGLSLTLKGKQQRLLAATSTDFSVVEVDTQTRKIASVTQLPRQVVDDYVISHSPPGTKIFERDALAVAWYRNRTVVAIRYETSDHVKGLLLWLEDSRVESLQEVPEAMLVHGGLLVVTLVGGESVAVHDGSRLRHWRLGEGPLGLAGMGSEVVVALSRADEVVRMNPRTGAVSARFPLRWKYPKGVSVWRGRILIAGGGTKEKPEGALIRIASDGTQDVLPLGSRHAEEIVVSGDFAFVTAIDDSTMVVVDLRRFVVVHKYKTGYLVTSPVLIR